MSTGYDIIDYRVANAVEVVTRKSTETEEPQPAIRHYSRYLPTGERNLYKLIRRALDLGFRFGVSVYYQRLGLLRVLVVSDHEWDHEFPEWGRYTSLEGRIVYDLIVPQQCLEDVLSEAPGEAYIASMSWGSRPALATLRFLHARPGVEVAQETIDAMRSLVAELVARGPPRSMHGRKTSYDPATLAILAHVSRNAVPASMARVAEALGIPPSRAQRKYYGLWRKRIIMGYSVACAPYCSRDVVFSIVEHSDPVTLAYASAVMPPVLEALVLVNERMRTWGVLLATTGGGSMVSAALNVVRGHWGRVRESIMARRESGEPRLVEARVDCAGRR